MYISVLEPIPWFVTGWHLVTTRLCHAIYPEISPGGHSGRVRMGLTTPASFILWRKGVAKATNSNHGLKPGGPRLPPCTSHFEQRSSSVHGAPCFYFRPLAHGDWITSQTTTKPRLAITQHSICSFNENYHKPNCKYTVIASLFILLKVFWL